ncbi:MAG: hypothetical protein IJT94_08500 [Oscillibacter sp.]|nr:hypothetical protein [Oscillibacter sp.]
MRDLVNWKDREVQYPNRYDQSDLGGGKVQITPSPGEVREEGTPQNAANFNKMDLAAFEALLIGNENTRMLGQAMRDIDGVKGLLVDVTLTNSQAYPFNNSQQTVQLPALRNTKDYFVIPETVECSGGFAGEYVVTDKLLNGFKIAFTGSASTVKVRCHVVGGM